MLEKKFDFSTYIEKKLVQCDDNKIFLHLEYYYDKT